MDKKKIKRIKIGLIIGLAIVLVGLLFFLFAGENFNVMKEIFNANASKEDIQDSIAKLGWRAYFVVFIISMFQVVLTFVPAEPLHVISGISFGFARGLVVCLAGIIVGNTIIFVLYKIFGKKVTEFFASNIEIDFKRARRSKRIALIVIILYCLPAIPYGIICLFAATVGMKYPKYILVTGIGSIPSLILDVGMGHITMSTSWMVSICIFALIVILLVLMFRYKKQLFDKVNAFIRKSQEKEKNRVGNYNPFIYGIASRFIYARLKSKVKMVVRKEIKKLDKPCIVLCNHGSFYDFVFAGKLIQKEQPHFIVARMYFHHKKVGWLARSTGAFPKSMFTADIECSKNCLKVINGGGVLAMMPEARLSTVGKFEDIQETTYKLIQKMNVSAYVIKSNGAYLAKPKWGDKVRKGALVETSLSKIFEAGECENLTIDEIKQKVEDSIRYDDFKWLETHPEVKYKHKTLAEGVENIISICPKCKNKYSLITKFNKITCECCGLEVEMDNRYALSGVKFKNVAEWYDWQVKQIKQEIDSNENFVLESNVELHHLSKDGKSFTRYAGNGVCQLTREGLTYIGTDGHKQVEKHFSSETIYRLLFGAGEDFEIYENDEIYYFVPEEKRSCVMWYIVSGLMKEKE